MLRLFIILLLSLVLSSCQQKPEEPQKLYEKYRNSVVLIKNKYYYSLTFENGKQLFFTPNEKGSTPQIHANEYEAAEKACFAFGTGFFIGREGQIATNRHVVNPLEQGKEAANQIARTIAEFKESLNVKIQEKLNEQQKIKTFYEANYSSLNEGDANNLKATYANLESQIQEMRNTQSSIDYNPDNTTIQVHVVDIGIAYDNTYVTSLNDFKGCVILRQASDSDIDLAILQLKDKRTPGYITNLIPLDEPAKRKDSVAINDDVYMIGYNEGLLLALTKKGIKSQFTIGKITQEPDDNSMLYSIPTLPGSSGSPIIDKWGHLVAVNFAKISDTQSFSFGIPHKHLSALFSAVNYGEAALPAATISINGQQPSVVPTANTQTPREQAYKNAIRGFVTAEDHRDYNRLSGYFANGIKRYWNLEYPTAEDLAKRYRDVWIRITRSRNIIKEIRKVADQTYDLYTEYEYYEISSQRTVSIASRVRFHFDSAGKMDEIYGVK